MMEQSGFSFHSPVKAFMGFHAVGNLHELLKKYNRITVVSGKSSVERTGFKEYMETQFKDKDVNFFNEIEENPSVNTIIKGGKSARTFKSDCVIGIGGGSPLDAAKAIAGFAANNRAFYEILNEPIFEKDPLPLILIPTTCGTGSEMNNYSIITDVDMKDKLNFMKENSFAKYAILDPHLLKSLDEKILLATVFDAFTHAFEGFISKRANPFSDMLAAASIELIMNTLTQTDDLHDDFALQNFMYASSLAGTVILHTGTTLLHALGYYLTNHKKIHHGTANAMMLKQYMDMLKDKNVQKASYVNMVLDRFQFKIDPFLEKMEAPKLKEVLTDDEIDEMVKYAVGKKNAEFTPFICMENHIKKFLM